jgi:hypothetical protein
MEKQTLTLEQLKEMVSTTETNMEKNSQHIEGLELQRSVIDSILNETPTSLYWVGVEPQTPLMIRDRYLFGIRMLMIDLKNLTKEMDYLETKNPNNHNIKQRKEYLLGKMNHCITQLLKKRKGLSKYNEKGLVKLKERIRYMEESEQAYNSIDKEMEELSNEGSFFSKLFSLTFPKNVDKLNDFDLVD